MATAEAQQVQFHPRGLRLRVSHREPNGQANRFPGVPPPGKRLQGLWVFGPPFAAGTPQWPRHPVAWLCEATTHVSEVYSGRTNVFAPSTPPAPACLLPQEEGGTETGPDVPVGRVLETPLRFPSPWKGQAFCMERPWPCFLSPLTDLRGHRLLAFSRGSSSSTASQLAARVSVPLGWAMSLSDLMPDPAPQPRWGQPHYPPGDAHLPSPSSHVHLL